MSFHDYENLGRISFHQARACLLESYRGSDIVDWHGRIEQSLVNLLHDAEKANNRTYAERIRTFMETWREHPIDGSLNRETLDLLSAASKQWSRESWDLQSYFLSLNTKLRQLIASEEELPRDVDASGNDSAMVGGGGGSSAGGMPPSFGPEGDAGDLSALGGEGGGGGDVGGMGGDADDLGELGDLGDLGGEEGGAEGAEMDLGAEEGGEAPEEEEEEGVPLPPV